MSRVTTYFGADTTGVRRGLDEAEGRVRKFGANVRRSMFRAFAVGALIMQLRSLSQELDMLDKTARRFGQDQAALDFVQDLQQQAKLSGASLGDATKAISRLMKEINRASGPSLIIASEIQALGLSLDDLRGLNAEQLFAVIAESIGGLETETDQLTAATNLLGRSADSLIPLLQDVYTKGGLAEAPRHTREAVQATVAINDSLTNLGATIKTTLSPAIVGVIALVQNFIAVMKMAATIVAADIARMIAGFEVLSRATKAAVSLDFSGVRDALASFRHTVSAAADEVKREYAELEKAVMEGNRRMGRAVGIGTPEVTAGDNTETDRERTGQRDTAFDPAAAARIEALDFERRMVELADTRTELEERRRRVVGEIAALGDNEVAKAEKKLELARIEARIRTEAAREDTERARERETLDRDQGGIFQQMQRIYDAFQNPANFGVDSMQQVGGGGVANMPNEDQMLRAMNKQLEKLKEIRDAIRATERDGGVYLS